MNEYAFNQCRYFLEQKISDTPESVELIKAYVSLITEKTKFDIAYFSQTAEIQKNWNDNHRDMNIHWQKIQAEITNQQIGGGRM